MRALAEDLAERIRGDGDGDGGGGGQDIWRAFADRELFARAVAALAVPFRGASPLHGNSSKSSPAEKIY